MFPIKLEFTIRKRYSIHFILEVHGDCCGIKLNASEYMIVL